MTIPTRMMNDRLRQLLVTLADRYETGAFTDGDPLMVHASDGRTA